MKKKKTEFLYILFGAIFILGVIFSLGGRALCIRDDYLYNEKKEELFAPDVIDTVLHDEALGQIYVCYNDASYVNVYTESGEFLWAVSTPYLNNAHFVLEGENLIIANATYAYIYRADNGAFIRRDNIADSEKYPYYQEETFGKTLSGKFSFGEFQVYRIEDDGSLTTVVSRPFWYVIFHSLFGWTIALLAGIGMGIVSLIEKYNDYKKAKAKLSARSAKQAASASKKDLKPEKDAEIKNKKVRFVATYFKAASAVQAVYAILNVLFGTLLEGALTLGLIPIALHFIISMIVISNTAGVSSGTKDEQAIINFWHAIYWATMITAFFSVVIASVILGATVYPK